MASVLIVGMLVAGCAEHIEVQATIGATAPAFALELTTGETFAFTGEPGNAKAVTFMSSWCPCSNESVPLLKEIHAQYQDRGIDMLMVGIQDPESKFLQFVSDQDLPFPAGYDDSDVIARTYGINAPPTTVFIDKDGTLQRIYYGNIKDMEVEVHGWMEELM